MSDRSAVANAIAAVVALAVLVGAVVVVLYLGGWWLFENNTRRSLNVQQHIINKQNKINRSSYEFQTAQRAEMENDLQNISSLQLQMQEFPQNADAIQGTVLTYVHQFCQSYESIQGQGEVTTDISDAAAKYHCN